MDVCGDGDNTHQTMPSSSSGCVHPPPQHNPLRRSITLQQGHYVPCWRADNDDNNNNNNNDGRE
ncbi:hypothetical protein LOAG_06050 [Loa loa]|uniref:Uncharacterized protein n=1 Tax=Loa loa TaxID=7209 RepID=A0A1I7VX99_LOALO|nr:hypothetical protein LOAG_06050 [Loa loa]EFO22437.1 hypothetical protein LOAG_06050 [Loa loa]